MATREQMVEIEGRRVPLSSLSPQLRAALAAGEPPEDEEEADPFAALERENERDDEEDEPDPKGGAALLERNAAPGAEAAGGETGGRDRLASLIPTSVVDRLNRLSPPAGSLFPLIVALLVLLFAIVPAGPNGDTRLALTWKALTGGVQLPASAKRIAILEARGEQVASAAGAASPSATLVGIEAAAGILPDTLWHEFWGFVG